MFGLSFTRIFQIALILATIYAGLQYIPPYINSYQFDDFMRQEVKYAVTTRRTALQVRRAVYERAVELSIPIEEEDIRITRQGPAFTLEVAYRIPVDLKVFRQDLNFRMTQSGESFEP